MRNSDIAAVCVTGQLRGLCSQADVDTLYSVLLSSFSSADLFVIVPSEDCQRATKFYADAKFRECIADEPFTELERNWIVAGPQIGYDRNKYILQLRLIYRCGAILYKHADAKRYQWLVRARADVRWKWFFKREDLSRIDRNSLWMSWTPRHQWQAFPDTFAIGSPKQMWPYLLLYVFLLDPSNWASYRFSHGDCHFPVKQRLGRQICNPNTYPELVLERYLFLEGVSVRQTWDVCFERLGDCGAPHRDGHCTHRVRPMEGNQLAAFWSRLLQKKHLDGTFPFVSAYSIEDVALTFPAYLEYDAVLVAKLIELFHREHIRLGRPVKVVDLGCGRGMMLKEFNKWGIPCVGIDDDALVTHTFPSLGMVENLISGELNFTIRSTLPSCSWQRTRGAFSSDFSYMSFDVNHNRHDDIDFIASYCCSHLSCVGFTSDGNIHYGIPSLKHPQYWADTNMTDLFIKIDKRFPTIIERSMDWVISLDIGASIPTQAQPGFIQNMINLATEGMILSWGRLHGDDEAIRVDKSSELAAYLATRGFKRDLELEAELKLFSGIACCGHRRHTLVVFRRTTIVASSGNMGSGHGHAIESGDDTQLEPLMSCRVTLAVPAPDCQAGMTFGCLNAGFMWVSGTCCGEFSVSSIDQLQGDNNQSPKRNISCCAQGEFFYSSGSYYMECALPHEETTDSVSNVRAQLSQNSRLRASIKVSQTNVAQNSTCAFGYCCGAAFEQVHKHVLAQVYDSLDPLIIGDMRFWSSVHAPCGLAVVVLKLFRLLVAPDVQFRIELGQVWASEMRFLLTIWKWWDLPQEDIAVWLPYLLRHVTFRAFSQRAENHTHCMLSWISSVEIRCSLSHAAGMMLKVSRTERQSHPGKLLRRLRLQATTVFRHASANRWRFGDVLKAGAWLWIVLDKRARHVRRSPIPFKVKRRLSNTGVPGTKFDHSPMGYYFYRLAALPY